MLIHVFETGYVCSLNLLRLLQLETDQSIPKASCTVSVVDVIGEVLDSAQASTERSA